MTLVYIALSGLLGVSGQLVLKRAVASLGPLAVGADAATVPRLALALAFNPLVILGLAIYAGGTFFWLLVLSRVDLGYAYPFASLNYVFVLLGAWWILGEQPSARRLLGVAAICLGVWAISRAPARTVAVAPPRAAGPARAVIGGTEP